MTVLRDLLADINGNAIFIILGFTRARPYLHDLKAEYRMRAESCKTTTKETDTLAWQCDLPPLIHIAANLKRPTLHILCD